MDPVPDIITANGEYYLPPARNGRESLLQICDALDPEFPLVTETFDGATVTPGYQDLDGFFTPYRNGLGETMPTTLRRGYSVRVPRDGLVAVKVTGAGASTQIKVALSGAVTMPP